MAVGLASALTTGSASASSLEQTESSSPAELVPEDDATHWAVQDGRWDDPAVWEGDTIPGDGARVLIEEGVTITVAHQGTNRLDWVRVEGGLQFDPTVDTHLQVDTMVTLPDSALQIGTPSTPISPDVKAQITFIDTGEFDIVSAQRGLVVEGDLTIHGAAKTAWDTLASDPTAGEDSVTLSSEPTGWSVGGEVLIPGTTPNNNEDERRTIASVDGTTVTFEAPLDYDHKTPAAGDTYALNVTRTVEFRSEADDPTRRAHGMVKSTGSDVRYCAFNKMGRTRKAEPLTNPPRNADTVSDDQPTNPRARYPFHYHRTGIGADDPHHAEGLVVEDAPGWGIVNHHARADVIDCITHDVLGAGFAAEGGNERGSFVGNFALRSEGSGEPLDTRAAGDHGGDPPIDDFGHAGHGFWFQSPLVAVRNNVAGGHRHQAFVWWLRPLLDGALAEGTSIDDSRVTYHPNVPIEYVDQDRIGPLWEAIQQDRFATGRNNDVMRETEKIPSTFAPLAEVSGNTAFGSAGGADFSRHNFKWIHERFTDFNTIEDMTVFGIGKFVDDDGEVHEPDFPRHLSSGHQGRGGSVGVSFRYTSNVKLKDSHLHGGHLEESMGWPFHDYMWTTMSVNNRFEAWDYAFVAGEHRIDWLQNNSFSDNHIDVSWDFINRGPAIVDGNNEFDTLNHKFVPTRSAADALLFGQGRGVRVDGRTSHMAESAPDYVPFPDDTSGVNNIEKYVDTVDDETELVGLTNAEMYDEYGVCISGRPMPDDAVEVSFSNSLLDPESGRDPPTAVYLDPADDATTLGAFSTVGAQDVSGGSCLEWTGSSSPKDDTAKVSFDCAGGTYKLFLRVRPDSWIGDDVYLRFDGGNWYTAEKMKSPVGFQWHDASPNNEPAYEFDLDAGEHTLEVAADNDGVRVDEIFVVANDDNSVLGGYGLSQTDDTAAAPAVDSLSMTEIETKNNDAEFDVSWDVSDDDGDLASVDLTLTQDSDGTSEDTVSLSVSGASASGTTRLVAASDEGTGNSYTVEATVADSSGNTTSGTASTTESESVPNVDSLSASEVGTSNSDAEFDVSWAVSDDDGDLNTIDLALTDDTDAESEDSATLDVSGDSASGTTRLVAAGDDGSGNNYTVEATVADSFDNTDSATASVTAAVDNSAPAVDGISLSEVETNNADAEFDASWAVSDSDGNLNGVDLALSDDTDAETEDSASLSVSGDSASGTTRLVAAGDDGSGNDYTLKATVTDTDGETDSSTTAAGESENAPAVDNVSASEVETDTGDAEFDVSWDVSDTDGDLASLELVLTQDSDDSTEDNVAPSVSGSSASGTTRLVAAGDDGSGNSYTVDVTVTDSFDNTDSATASVEEGESNDRLSDGLVGHWEFEETSGPVVDSSENDLDGTNNGATRGVSGPDGSKAIELDGSNYVDLPDDSSLPSGDDPYTLSAWFRTSQDHEGGLIGWGDYDNCLKSNAIRVTRAGADGEISFKHFWWCDDLVADTSVKYNDAWHHVVATYDGSSREIWLDGQRVASDSPPSHEAQIANAAIGLTHEEYFQGRISDVRAYERSLDDTEIQALWEQFEQTDSQKPYTDHDLSRIQAEDFDTGGEGVAYHDTSSGNKGGAYRDTDVDIQEASDESGKYNLAWIREGEWWEYTVDVPADGEYNLSARLAGKNATSLDVVVDGTQGATIDVPNTGGWQEWTTVKAGSVSLTAGTHTIRLTANGGSFNINWFGFK